MKIYQIDAFTSKPFTGNPRFFVPSGGIDEDPVTGAAHTVLAPYWSNLLKKNTLKAYQASARGGEIELELQANRVQITGQAVVIMESELLWKP